MRSRITIACLPLTLLLVTAARADLRIDWSNPNGYWDNTDTTAAANVTGGGIYAILILDADGFPGFAIQGDLSGGGTILAESDLAAVAGNPYGYGATISVGPLPFTGGYVYARVFQASDQASAANTPGTYYYDGPVVAVQDVDLGNIPPALPQAYNANLDTSTSPYGGDPINTSICLSCPEPRSVCLTLLGSVLIARRNRGLARMARR